MICGKIDGIPQLFTSWGGNLEQKLQVFHLIATKQHVDIFLGSLKNKIYIGNAISSLEG